MKYKIIFFDFDGTLIDTLPDIAIAVNKSMEHYGLKDLPISLIRGFIGEGSKVLINKCIEVQENIAINDNTDQIHEFFLKYYRKNYFIRSALYPGVLESLHKINCIKIVYTNKPYLITGKICKKTGISDTINEIISPEVYKVKKPDPLPVFKTAKKYNVSLNEILLVGDSMYDIKCSKNAGIKNCIVRYGYSNPDDIKNADILIDKFDEILNII
jgi:phosphoglycolate phosphatase